MFAKTIGSSYFVNPFINFYLWSPQLNPSFVKCYMCVCDILRPSQIGCLVEIIQSFSK